MAEVSAFTIYNFPTPAQGVNWERLRQDAFVQWGTALFGVHECDSGDTVQFAFYAKYSIPYSAVESFLSGHEPTQTTPEQDAAQVTQAAREFLAGVDTSQPVDATPELMQAIVILLRERI